MHDLRLVGVHEDGEHLLLSDVDGERYSLPVDEALRAAVRRDRAHLGQLQIEIEGGLRPRDVQARIRAGASADEVAALAGWTVEKVRRYEGPVLAERENVADLARKVRVRRPGAEPVELGVLVNRRLAGRGVDPDRLTWDAWRPATGPWTVVAVFAAGGREREARWHVDLRAMSVVAADDEARWLSEDEASAKGPLSPARLSAVRESQTGVGSGVSAVYDIEADGGVTAEPRRPADADPLDLVSAMRSRRRGGAGASRRPSSNGQVVSTGDQPSDVPGSTHPAGRRRAAPEPLELDPTLMDDPPAAHPPASEVSEVSEVMEQHSERPPAGHWPLAESMRPAPVGDGEPVLDLASTQEQAPAEGSAPARPATRSAPGAGRRGRRSSVPSWDDIVFGAKKD